MEDGYVSVSIETWGAGPDSIDEDVMGELGTILEDLGATGAVTSIGGLAGGPGATFGLQLGGKSDPDNLTHSCGHALKVFLTACEKAGIPIEGIANIEITTERYLELDLERDPERFAGLHEVAEFLGVSKQRVAELRVRPGFPAPIAELAAGPVWTVSSLSRFLSEWPRRPGRPRTRPAAKAV